MTTGRINQVTTLKENKRALPTGKKEKRKKEAKDKSLVLLSPLLLLPPKKNPLRPT